jgi:putative endonuclease
MNKKDLKKIPILKNIVAKNTTSIGATAELAARRFLEKNGLTFRAANYRCRLGEIDLIMQEPHVLVFVEVRMRNSAQYGTGAETVTLSKQTKIIHTAQHFLSSNPQLSSLDCRLDVVSIGASEQKIDWYKNAFTLDR